MPDETPTEVPPVSTADDSALCLCGHDRAAHGGVTPDACNACDCLAYVEK